MLILETLLKTLLITKLCLSLTIYQPTYLNYSGQGNNAAALNLERKQFSLPQIIKSQGSGLKSENNSINTAAHSQLTPYQAGAISHILSQTTSLNYNQPGGYSNIYPVQYQFHNPLSAATRPTSNTLVANEQQPVTAASLESEILLTPNKEAVTKLKPISSVNYNNKIYHFNNNKRASPLANNEQEKPTFIIRNQGNLRENHDDKLIEQNNKEIQDRNDVNDQTNATTTAAASSSSSSSIKQPSSMGSLTSYQPTTKTSSHEIRYLHDIFLNYPKSLHVNSGHVELSPVLFEKRFESQKAGNRYKGEVMWLDNTGGFAQHYWDLAQGKL